MRMLDEIIPFGDRYWLTAILAVGGMAELYLARQAAMAGFEKDVVIKRLKPELAHDLRLVDMFLDEARICALINHPNIVHVYDVDSRDGVPYIAMEYINGAELNDLCRRGLSLGNFLPFEHAVELIRQAASGLGHVHAQRDMHRQPLEIVHRDISPTNLLVTQEGFLKIIDFGIARANNQTYRNDALVPGKLSYMSPEQAAREPIDHHTDIFALGIVLYEITVGRRLFKGPSSVVIDRLLSCDITPPTLAREGFPPALEAIIMRTLARYPSDRYHSAYDLSDDLERFLRDAGLNTGPVQIARYLDELTMAEGGERRPELISESEIARMALSQSEPSTQADNVLNADEPLMLEPDDISIVDPDTLAPSAAPSATDEDTGEHHAWDEYDEGEAEVAVALGVDVEEFQRMLTPVPVTEEVGVEVEVGVEDDERDPFAIAKAEIAETKRAEAEAAIAKAEAEAEAVVTEVEIAAIEDRAGDDTGTDVIAAHSAIEDARPEESERATDGDEALESGAD